MAKDMVVVANKMDVAGSEEKLNILKENGMNPINSVFFIYNN